jgi:hypothetical protein
MRVSPLRLAFSATPLWSREPLHHLLSSLSSCESASNTTLDRRGVMRS